MLLTDLGNVVVTFQQRTDWLKQICINFGGDPTAVEKVFESEIKAGLTGEAICESLDLGTLALEQVYMGLVQYGGVADESFSFEHFLFMYPMHLKPIEDVIMLYKRLKVPLVAVSNGDAGSRHVVNMLKVLYGVNFSKVFTSCEQGNKKPRLLYNVLEWLLHERVRPCNCLFVDDIAAYCQAAEELGIPSLCFNGSLKDHKYLNLLEQVFAQKGWL